MAWLWLPALGMLPASVEAQDRSFHGVYLGAEAGREDFIGGSYVDGTDVLAQETRGVLSVVAGARYQTSGGLVLGFEGTWGSTDGNLTMADPGSGLSIDYANDSQTSLGATIGYALGGSKSVHVFAYASEVTRHFDVHVVQGATEFTQEDEQGMLRYGLGIEAVPVRRLHVRFKVGSGRADFGDATTNITPEHPLQFGLGVALQF